MDQGETTPSTSPYSLPFASDAFDLVIDRHSSYWPSEVRRVLRRGGHFITQQRSEAGITGFVWEDLFDRPSHAHRRFTLNFAVDQLVAAGFEISKAEEADTPMTFLDLPAVVYYLRIVPWAVEGFDPVADRDALEFIQKRLLSEGQLLIRGSHMIIDAVRPV